MIFIHIIINIIYDTMNKLSIFWKTIDNTKKNKETQLETYIKNNANEHILRFIKLGGGPSLGSMSEQYAKFIFNELKDRLMGDSSHDHTIVFGDIILKIEQKTSTLNKSGDFMWQHVAEKHPWDILLLMGIHYNEIIFYGMNKDTFKKLVSDGKITNQGSKNKDSEQGMWFRFSNVKNDIPIIKTNEDIIKLYNCRDVLNNKILKDDKNFDKQKELINIDNNDNIEEETQKITKVKKNKSTINK